MAEATTFTCPQQALKTLIEAGLTYSEAQEVFASLRTGEELAFVNKAIEIHYDEGHLEVDEGAIVSQGEDDGAYVQAWVWVEK